MRTREQLTKTLVEECNRCNYLIEKRTIGTVEVIDRIKSKHNLLYWLSGYELNITLLNALSIVDDALNIIEEN